MPDPAAHPAPAQPPATPAAPGPAAGSGARAGRRSKLVAWMLRLFLVFQALAIVQVLFDLVWPTNFVDFPGLILGFTCLQNLAILPLVMAIGVWVLAKSYRYNRTATRLAKLIVARFVLRLIGSLLGALTLILLLMATVPHLLQSRNPVATIENELTRMVNEHSTAYRLGLLFVLGFEGLFVLLALLARKRLRTGHFDPAPAAPMQSAGAPPIAPATNATAAPATNATAAPATPAITPPTAPPTSPSGE